MATQCNNNSVFGNTVMALIKTFFTAGYLKMSWYKQSKKEKGHIAASQPDRDKEIDVDYTRAKMRDMFRWIKTLLRMILFRANVRTVAS